MPWHVATVCALLGIYVFIKEMKDLLYYSVKIFFHSILSIFFSNVEIIGVQNIPTFGPCIFSVNHANQFVDALMLVCTCQRHVSYLMADVSYRRRVVGDLAWAMGVVPVKRAQDSARKGTGQITITLRKDGEEETGSEADIGGPPPEEASKNKGPTFWVNGYGTTFIEQLHVGDKIRPPGTPVALKIKEILNDTTLILDGAAVTDAFETFDLPRSFDVLERVDQKKVYEKVLDRIACGGAIGIFPEGGSHDRTDLLPLKVGVALIAYSALEQDSINVPIVPVGLNYFQAHRWRGRAVVEFGRPIRINPSTLKHYKHGGSERRKVCSELLDRVEDSMKSVIVSAPDYDSLQIIHTARRLYQRKGQLETLEKQDLNRRFAEGYKRLLLMTDGNPPKEWQNIQNRLVAYHKELMHLGIRDYQVPTLGQHADGNIDGDTVLGYMDVFYQILNVVFLLLLAAVPTLFINMPIGVMAGMYSERRRKVLLARSKVKVRAYDVVLTEKILFCIVMIPSLWFLYGLLLFHFTDMDGPTLALSISTMPAFAYVGIIVTEAGMVDLKDLRPWVMKLFPSSRRRLAALPDTRLRLQRDLRNFIKKLGPVLGEIYYKKDLDWGAIQEKARVLSDNPPALSDSKHQRRGTEVSDTLEIPAGEIRLSEITSKIRISEVMSNFPPTIEDLQKSITQQPGFLDEPDGNEEQDEGGDGPDKVGGGSSDDKKDQ